MHDYYKAEPKTLQADAKAVALKEWKLLDEEHRSVYQERAAGTLLLCASNCKPCETALAGFQRNHVFM